MSKNVWLERAEKKKVALEKSVREKTAVAQALKNKVKFKGKFQEANKVNKQGRMYTSEALEKSIRDIAAEYKAAEKVVKEIDPDATIIANCSTRTMIAPDEETAKRWKAASPSSDVWVPVEERWLPPSDDECGWIPIRPTAEAIKINQESMQQVSEEAKNEFIDLSAVKGSNSRYKEYDRLRKQTELMEDAMVVYQTGRSEPKDCDDQAALDAGDLGEDYPGEAQDIAYFRNKLFSAMRFPSVITAEKRQKKLEELKLEVMANNPMVMGVPAPEGWNNQSYTIGTAGPAQSVSISGPTALRFQPDQITHHVIGGERRVFSVEVKPENAEKFMENLKAQFKKKRKPKTPSEVELKAEFTARAMEKMEALAAESETWFTPSVIGIMADVFVDTYKTLTAKIDNMCNEAFMDTTVTMDPAMAENVMSMDKLPACETFTVTSSADGWQGAVEDGRRVCYDPVQMGC